MYEIYTDGYTKGFSDEAFIYNRYPVLKASTLARGIRQMDEIINKVYCEEEK